MPHVPIAASYHFKNRSEHGIYGDVIEELDWSVGQVMDHLEKLGLEEKSIVMFTSDNGAAIWKAKAVGPDTKVKMSDRSENYDFGYKYHN